MAIRVGETRIIDPFHGQNDLQEKLIRAVGNPTTRFKEDPLRMLRACRFASQLGCFFIEANTLKSIRKHAHKILEVSRERWMEEINKLLLTRDPRWGLNYLEETRLLNYMFPELAIQVNYDQNTPYHSLNLWHHTMKVVNNLPIDLHYRWAGLLHDVGKPFVRQDKNDHSIYPTHDLLSAEIVDRYAKTLKWSNDLHENVWNIVANHMNKAANPTFVKADKNAK
jgi:putative nucleotidyltransferase with HDIG domain